jgi:excisionase family DNA binding protein
MRTNGHPGQIERVLAGLTRLQLLQAIAQAQHRRNVADVILNLLQARLASLVSAPAQNQGETFLTADEAAKRLKLSRPRVFELVRQGRLRKVLGLGKQVRIPASSLSQNQPKRPENGPLF